MSLPPGTRIDRYEVEEPLGRGGMATVYRVRHAELGTRFALKLLDHRSPEIRERLLAEGRMQASLHHPNVVTVIDVVVHEGCPGLVMEYVDGPTLQQLIESRLPLPADVRDALVTGILHGVRAAHHAGFVHRDLKPGNILLARSDGRLLPKVADFGLARATEADDGARRTRTGMVFGTPVYMAPEQTRSAKDADARADVFALGVILYELVTGRVPVDTDDLITLFTRLSTRDYPRARALAPELPAHQDEAIWRALEPDRERRIPDCSTLLAVWRGTATFDGAPAEIDRTHPFDSQFLTAVETLVSEGRSGRDSGRTVPVSALAPPPRWTPLWVAAGVGLVGVSSVALAAGVVVLVGGLWWASRPDPAPIPSPVPLAAAPAPEPVPVPPPPAAVEVPDGPPAPARPLPTARIDPPPGPTAPEPAAPPPAPPREGSIVVTGDASEVRLVSASGVRPTSGPVPPGEYTLRATYPSGRTSDLRVKIPPGTQVHVDCQAKWVQCRPVP